MLHDTVLGSQGWKSERKKC